MTFGVIVCTVTLAAIFVAWYLDRVAGDVVRVREGELERRVEEQSAQIAQLVRALESGPERRPKVTRTRPEPPAAAPVPVPAPNPKPAGAREEPEPEPESEPAPPPKKRSRREDLQAAAKELRATGMSYRKIGEALGVSDETARRYANGIDRTGRSQEEPQAELDLAPKKERKKAKRQIKITYETRPSLIQSANMMRAHGMSYADIAKALKISRTSARRYVKGTYRKADRHQGEEGES